jgi:hypothetical protein
VAEKPRVLIGTRDMVWSIAALVVFMVVIAGIASRCEWNVGGPKAGPIPNFDAHAALQYDADELGFPIREPAVPEGWTPNSGRRAILANEYDATTVGYIDSEGNYIQLTQSNAPEEALVPYIADEPRIGTGQQDLDGRDWMVYGGEGVEPIWITNFGEVRVLLTGNASDDSFATLARAVQQAKPLPSR